MSYPLTASAFKLSSYLPAYGATNHRPWKIFPWPIRIYIYIYKSDWVVNDMCKISISSNEMSQVPQRFRRISTLHALQRPEHLALFVCLADSVFIAVVRRKRRGERVGNFLRAVEGAEKSDQHEVVRSYMENCPGLEQLGKKCSRYIISHSCEGARDASKALLP